MIFGLVGIYCSLKLLLGVKRSSEKRLLWWIVYQWVAIIHVAFVYAVSLNIVDESPDWHCFVRLFAVVVVVHIAHELFFLASIMKLHSSLIHLRIDSSDNAQNQNDDQQILTAPTEKPPCYEEAVSAPVAPK